MQTERRRRRNQPHIYGGDAVRLVSSLQTLRHYFMHLLTFQVKCDVLAPRWKFALRTNSDTSSQEWWALSWPDREVSILIANCQKGDARGMIFLERARGVAAGAETSCLPPWCSSPTSFQGCCGKPTTAHMSGGWLGSGKSRGFSESRRWSKRPKCWKCWERQETELILIMHALTVEAWGRGDYFIPSVPETLWLKNGRWFLNNWPS